VEETLEMTRIIQKGDKSNPDFAAAEKAFSERYQKNLGNKEYYEKLLVAVKEADATVQKQLGKEVYTKEEVAAIKSTDEKVTKSAGMITNMFNYADTIAELKEELTGGIEYYANSLNYNLNKDFNGRTKLGDNPDDYSVKVYGDNNVITDADHAKHGTHVAGIIGAQRNNNIGMNGVANNVQLMAVRVVPDGDEHDKDVALGIIYAVDNGAKVINTSFGKDFSPHRKWVDDAIKYAAKHDVLIVNAAGNDAKDLNENLSFPNDSYQNGPEISDTFLTVGALNYEYSGELIASFSNYGKHDVDVFAPGVKIWATTPNNEYEFLQGTSMASPAVAGVADLIRSQFPKVKAKQVKKIIMQSGLSSKTMVTVGKDKKAKLEEISTSGIMVNAYNALILASKVASGKVSL
jgi:subtilisin family serine protease